jgi:hypothetical protein
LPLFFALTLFLSAFLLFLVQPLVGKMVLPLVGGTPVVWNTCMVFFQGVLLGGYLYSHASTKYLDLRRQTRIHLGLLVLTMLALGTAAALLGQPIAVSESLSPQGYRIPVFGMLLVLALAVGLPFFTVSTSAPLLQRWFSSTRSRSAKDPYFLYGASNLGSVLALVAYPVFIEPRLRLAEQSWVWSAGFLALAFMIGVCGWLALKSPVLTSVGVPAAKAPSAPRIAENTFLAEPQPAVSWPRRLRWLALAFVPSSMMLGVTTYLVTDIASIPLFWIIPLGLYLFTFIIAFPPLPGGAQMPKQFLNALRLIAPLLVLLPVFLLISHITIGNTLAFLLYLSSFLAVALTCHCDLAHSRPSAEHLTEFFLIVSLGGVLGGLFNALVAPLIFNDVYEFEVALVLACFMLPAPENGKQRLLSYALDGVAVLGMTVLTLLLADQIYKEDPARLWSTYATPVPWWRRAGSEIAYRLVELISWLGAQLQRPVAVSFSSLFSVVTCGIPTLVCYLFVDRPLRFGLCVATLILVTHFHERQARTSRIYEGRSFFGVLRINEYTPENEIDPQTEMPNIYHELVHGTTVHGMQRYASADYDSVDEPLTYYHSSGPIGELIHEFSGPRMKPKMAVIGLGTGTMAAHAQAGQNVTFFEIDPLVKWIAENPKYFTNLKDCKTRGANYEIVLGDARVQMERRKGEKFGMIVVDAFSSDSIPVHLLTKQAVQMYFEHLEDDGVLVLHISNRYLDLERVVARLADELKVTALLCRDSDDKAVHKTASNWVAVARNSAALSQLRYRAALTFRLANPNYLESDPSDRYGLAAAGGAMPLMWTQDRWVRLKSQRRDPLWTDDFSNLLGIIDWQLGIGDE